MVFHPSLARHIFPASPTILGYRLQTFSLWHWQLLLALGSPFFSEDTDADITLGDLQIALHLCSHAPLSRVESLTPPRIRSLWQKAIYGRTWILGGRQFMDYANEACSAPDIMAEEGGSMVKTGVPDYRVECLVRHGIPRADAWAYSPGRAAWLICSMAEAAGHPQKIVTPADAETFRKAGHKYELR